MEMAAIHGLTTAIQVLFEQFVRRIRDRFRELVETVEVRQFTTGRVISTEKQRRPDGPACHKCQAGDK